MGERLETEGTWVAHRGAGVTVFIEITSATVGSKTRWGADAVLERGRRVALKGGTVPAGAKLGHMAMLQAARDQAQALPAGIVLGTGGESGDLF